jgi:D-alanyl-D-alanine carboxypeptidase (penicillin-binding protein 5/6)
MPKFPLLVYASVLLLLSGLTGCAVDQSAPLPPSTTATIVAPHAASSLWPVDAPQIKAVSAILIDARTGQTLYQKNADEPRQVASTQKLVTALIVAQSDPMDGPVHISHEDTIVEPTKVGIRAGEVYPRRQLLRAMLVHSANDCASALAHAHAGSLGAFAEEMNDLATRYGATHSHFVNPHGLPASQYSTARDMARIAFRAYRNPDIREAVALRGYCFRYARGGFSLLSPTDRLLLCDPYFNGMKTGFTDGAGKCLISSYSRGGRDFILVQLGSRSRYIFDDAQRMMGWAMSR